ncbi:MAG: hypothetical protein GTO46_09700 [Gemmatimonadetes bacterium]|nr:hypothetical protein [Gemmatimonadota bacterium]NIO31887.1 hypothetical protein [Gemmatimonadota bacterium]
MGVIPEAWSPIEYYAISVDLVTELRVVVIGRIGHEMEDDAPAVLALYSPGAHHSTVQTPRRQLKSGPPYLWLVERHRQPVSRTGLVGGRQAGQP